MFRSTVCYLREVKDFNLFVRLIGWLIDWLIFVLVIPAGAEEGRGEVAEAKGKWDSGCLLQWNSGETRSSRLTRTPDHGQRAGGSGEDWACHRGVSRRVEGRDHRVARPLIGLFRYAKSQQSADSTVGAATGLGAAGGTKHLGPL